MTEMTAEQRAFSVALSGGGVRAAAFHSGVMRYLAEQGRLGDVVHISSVSGGSLFVGMVFYLNDYSWPSSEAYLSMVFPRFRQILTTKSLQRSALRRLIINPLNWRFLLSRANVLAQAIEATWGVNGDLAAIDNVPSWSINCTTAETGRRFRFKRMTMGDYELGYASVEKFSLAKAMAISAAFPGGIGPLSVKTKAFQWRKRPGEWGQGQGSAVPFAPPFKRLHLYDGGLYDNLGIEPLFDIGKQTLKRDETLDLQAKFLLVSDAGAALGRKPILHPLNPFRFERIVDIALDQTRSLRVRALMNVLQRESESGAYLGIGATAGTSIHRCAAGREPIAARLQAYCWLSEAEARLAAAYRTTLCRMTEPSFDLIARHGYETAKWNLELLAGWPAQATDLSVIAA
ncbi:patatin-like phospholipase family protein [Janthinobacterium sp. 64]|uniref:patatin-like phospholipase family protein n=1 Tax=Janthinobacterium sp. 64 TaxID=2035208 RepID=UPI000C2C7833|nr:patatin-like phospholipase family protein [Janthinobacterium sp. 64]PKB13759.1 NTE family protein [Janthinobacterium sp. 64]